MPNPRTAAFWDAERDALWNAVAELSMRSLAAGTLSGEMMLPAAIRPLIAWDVLNQAALDYLHRYRLDTIYGISDTTAKRAIATIDKWMQAGEPMPILEARLEPIFGATRSGMIATTEVTRLYAEGNQMAWQASGVVAGNKWMTARDERVCPYCGPLHGMVAPLRTYFNEQLPPGLRELPWGGVAPPRHTNCRCFLLPVVTEVSLERELERVLAGFER